MAITAPHYRLFKSLKPLLPQGGTLLEIGEANWYGDVDPLEMLGWADDSASETIKHSASTGNLFSIAKAFYAALFRPSFVASIDLNGTERAIRHDLNLPLESWTISRHEVHSGKFDLVINHGTAEHVFNIAQVFKTMHDHCETGGLMMHDAPFHGWIDHGFYCLQPTLFYDLAAANNYEIVRVVIGEIGGESIPVESREHVHELATAGKIPKNALLLVVFRKIVDAPFRIPAQGYYANSLSPTSNKAWKELR